MSTGRCRSSSSTAGRCAGADDGTESLIVGEASYVIASGSGRTKAGLTALVEGIAKAQTESFGSFLIVELWSAPDTSLPAEASAWSPGFRILRPRRSKLTATVTSLENALSRGPREGRVRERRDGARDQRAAAGTALHHDRQPGCGAGGAHHRPGGPAGLPQPRRDRDLPPRPPRPPPRHLASAQARGLRLHPAANVASAAELPGARPPQRGQGRVGRGPAAGPGQQRLRLHPAGHAHQRGRGLGRVPAPPLRGRARVQLASVEARHCAGQARAVQGPHRAGRGPHAGPALPRPASLARPQADDARRSRTARVPATAACRCSAGWTSLC